MKTKTADQFRILIVDDIPKNIQVLGNILRNHSYQTGFATNGQQALKSLEKHEFDLVLLDIMMPGMDGYEVCQKIRANNKTKDIPIIFLTAKVEKESIVKGFEIGAQDYLTKPFNAEELLARVGTHLELSDKRKQLAGINKVLEEKVKERTAQLQKTYDELQIANEKLGQLEKTKSDFLTIISHELRTPLNGILGFTDILRHTIHDEEQLEYLGYLEEGGERLIRFADAAVLIAQLSIDRYKLSIKDIPFKEVVDLVVKNLNEKIEEKKISVSFACPEDEINCKCDSELLEIAIKNIVENAVKYSPNAGEIKIAGKQENGEIIVSITDEGQGFSEEALEKLFGFFAADKVMHHSEGYGLGLAAAKLILEAHNGKLLVENRDEGGAEVKIIMQAE